MKQKTLTNPLIDNTEVMKEMDKEFMLSLVDRIKNQTESLTMLDTAIEDIYGLNNEWVGIMFRNEMKEIMTILENMRTNLIQMRDEFEEILSEKLSEPR